MPDLPERPSLEHLRKQAKARRRERAIGLSEAQHELAREYGFDTSPLIAHDEEGALELPEAAAISVITLGELRAGVLSARDAPIAHARRRRLAAVRAAFAAPMVDEAVAERYGDVLVLARSTRRAVKATGLLIIASAATTGRELYTLDAAQSRPAPAAGLPATLL